MKFMKFMMISSILIFCMSGFVRVQAAEPIPGSAGSKALDFTLNDLNGKAVNFFKDFAKKKALILVFSATWCPYCIQEIPTLKSVYAKYKDKGVEIVFVDPQETKERVQAIVDKYKIPYVVLLDEKGEVARSYRVMGVPTIVFLDTNYIIKWRSSGGEIDYDGRLKELGIK